MIEIIRKKSEELFNKNFKEMGLYLVRFNGAQGILRCKHTEKENAIKLLSGLNL